MNSKRSKKKLIGVYKQCIDVLTRGYSLPLSGGGKRKDGSLKPVRSVASKTENYINKVKKMISEV